MSVRITYTDLLESVTEGTDVPKEKILSVIKRHLNPIRKGLQNDGRVEIKGLGHFELGGADSKKNGIQFLRAYKPFPEKSSIHKASQRKKKAFFGFILLLIVIISFLLFWIWPRYNNRSDDMTLKNNSSEISGIDTHSSAETGISITPSNRIPGTEHIIKLGDRLWILSDRYYGNAYLWPYIYDENSSIIKNPDIIEIGKIIFIPSLEGSTGILTVRDKENIANGYIKVYLTYLRMNNPIRNRYLWVAEQVGGRKIMDNFYNQIRTEDRILANKMKGRVLVQ